MIWSASSFVISSIKFPISGIMIFQHWKTKSCQNIRRFLVAFAIIVSQIILNFITVLEKFPINVFIQIFYILDESPVIFLEKTVWEDQSKNIKTDNRLKHFLTTGSGTFFWGKVSKLDFHCILNGLKRQKFKDTFPFWCWDDGGI